MSAPGETTSPPSEGSSTSTSGSASTSSTWTSKLEDGENYRVIRGKKANSKIIVSGDKCYLVEKTTPDKSATGEVRNIYYLKCHDPDCLGRAVIKKKVLELKTTDNKRHTCQEAGAGLDKIAIQEALNRMKKRAREEGSTYYVRILFTNTLPRNNL